METRLNENVILTVVFIVSDFNECSTNTHGCNQESTCVNEEGTFSCKCNSGYDGDGVACKGMLRRISVIVRVTQL
jgi:hypothetical protein